MLKTSYEEIVDIQAIGERKNTRDLNQILQKANLENLQPAVKNSEQVFVIGIDYQLDFLENGALAVSNSNKDVENFTKFLYNNIDKISQIAVSIDTHNPFQIFHSCWWVDRKGNNPPPFAPITIDDLDNGKWLAVIKPIESREYVEQLKQKSKKDLIIWPYHCIQGTTGCALDNQLTNMIYFFSVAKKSMVMRLVKGQDILSEMYGIIKPEYDKKNFINIDFLNKIEQFDKIILGGEAADYCCYESVKQILEFYANKPEVLNKFYILEDCMSGIQDKKVVEKMYHDLQKQFKINLVKTTEFSL